MCFDEEKNQPNRSFNWWGVVSLEVESVLLELSILIIILLTHLFPMRIFSTPGKHPVEKGCIGGKWVK